MNNLKKTNILEIIKYKLEVENKFDVNRKLIRFTILNKESQMVFSEFINFENIQEIAIFLKFVVIPSSILSILAEENGEVIIILDEFDNFEKFGFENDIIENLNNIINRIDKISMVKDEKKEIKTIIAKINNLFIDSDFTVIGVEYADNIKKYLNELYLEYDLLGELDTLEKELLNINLCMGGFKEICENPEKYKDELKEKLLDKLPY